MRMKADVQRATTTVGAATLAAPQSLKETRPMAEANRETELLYVGNIRPGIRDASDIRAGFALPGARAPGLATLVPNHTGPPQ